MTRALSVGTLLMLLAVAAARPQQSGPEQGQLDASETLFTVLAAINAAGYDADLQSPANHPLRRQLRNYLAARRFASVERLKDFFERRRQENWTAELSQYVSFALLVDGPPAFEFKWLTYELPPDVQRLDGLGPLLAEFYREADIPSLWRKAQPAIDDVIARYHEPVTRALLEVNGYLRHPTSGDAGRRFQIYVDLLGAPNQIHSRTYRTDYFVVVTRSPEPQISDIRYFYMHYVLDPLATRYAAKLDEKKALGDYVLGAPYLEDHYKSDFLLLATTSLIKAIESRLDYRSAEQRQALVDKAWRSGFILTPHFAEQLPHYERQEQAMRLYFAELADAIDLKREEIRVQDLEYDTERPVRMAKRVPVVEPGGAYKTLEEAEEFYRKRDLDKARETYMRVLRETGEKPLHAKSYYGLARVAALRNEAELSATLFKKTLELSPEPQVKAWALVYLGRLEDFAGEREEAAHYYGAALAVEGASPAAREAAEEGIQGAFQKNR